MVIATQNPVDYEGTFPLPESQMDRFLMRMEMGYPEFEYELDILKAGHLHYDHLEATPVVSRKDVAELQEYTRRVFVEDTVAEYIVRLAVATREESAFRTGVSPRGTLSLKKAAQACALAQGRAFVMPEDVQRMLHPVFSHRLALRKSMSDPMEERRSIEALLTQLEARVAEPV
jgi:MoxR-like ATPase